MNVKLKQILNVLFVNHKQAYLKIIKAKHIVISMQLVKMAF
jgi:hypothetical protein